VVFSWNEWGPSKMAPRPAGFYERCAQLAKAGKIRFRIEHSLVSRYYNLQLLQGGDGSIKFPLRRLQPAKDLAGGWPTQARFWLEWGT
jgi:hypothetical protein